MAQTKSFLKHLNLSPVSSITGSSKSEPSETGEPINP